MSRKKRRRAKQARPHPGSAGANTQPAAPTAEGTAAKLPRFAGNRAAPAALPGLPAGWPGAALPIAALLLLTVAAYWPAFFAGFVWDDNKFIVEEAAVRQLSGLLDIWFNSSSLLESHYWPLLYTSFWLEHKLWGFNPAGYHAVSILLHGVNSVLLWRLLARMGVPGAWAIAAVFVLHPVHVEAVAWIIARKDLLATFFYLLAVGCWLRYRERPQAGTYLALLAFYLAGTLSKTVAITLPATLLVWVWWQQGRITARDFSQVAPLFLLGLVIGGYGISHYATETPTAAEHSLAESVIIAAKALWFYAGKLLWPEPLLFIYHHWDKNPAQLLNWLPVLGALALAAALWLARHRIGRGPLAGALFFAITLAPTLGLVPFRFMQFSFAADRYQYLALAGLVAVLVGGAVHLGQRLMAADAKLAPRHWRQLGWGALALMLTSYGLLSHQRSLLFQDQVVLFRDVVATNPSANEVGHILGTFLMERKRWQEAEEAYLAALEHYPAEIKIHANLASILMEQERLEEAEQLLQQALEYESAHLNRQQSLETATGEVVAVRINLGLILKRLGRLEEAEQALERALELKPGSKEARHNLVLVLQEQGNHAKALRLLEQIARLNPSVDVYYQMGELATELGQTAVAERYFNRALSASPESAYALKQQAVVLFQSGKYEESLRMFRQSIARNPEDAEAHANLGAVLGQMGRYQEAVHSLEQALAIDPGLKAVRENLEKARSQLPPGP